MPSTREAAHAGTLPLPGAPTSARTRRTPAASQQQWRPSRARPSEAGTALTDLGNAERFVKRYGNRVRYVAGWGWLIWDGCRWRRDATNEVMRYAKQTVHAIIDEAGRVEDDALRKKLLAHGRRSEATARLKALLESAQSESGIAATHVQFDRDPWLLNVRNGTLDLRTGTLRRHRQGDHLTKLAPVTYDPQATSPVWDQFLADITAGDTDLQRYLQRAVGYSLTGRTDEQCLFLCHGTGRNGKSTFLEVIHALLGEYALAVRPETVQLSERGSKSGASNDVAALAGRRYVITSETGQNKRLDLGLVKQLAGGDSVSARYLYREYFEFRPQLKLWLATNHLPTIDEQTPAVWERLKLIPFPAHFSEAQRNPHLIDRLLEERTAILAWAVAGCLAWRQEGGLAEPAIVHESVRAYQLEQNPFAEFLAHACWLGDDRTEGATALLQAYNMWRDAHTEAPISGKALAALLKAHGFVSFKRKSGNAYRGSHSASWRTPHSRWRAEHKQMSVGHRAAIRAVPRWLRIEPSAEIARGMRRHCSESATVCCTSLDLNTSGLGSHPRREVHQCGSKVEGSEGWRMMVWSLMICDLRFIYRTVRGEIHTNDGIKLHPPPLTTSQQMANRQQGIQPHRHDAGANKTRGPFVRFKRGSTLCA